MCVCVCVCAHERMMTIFWIFVQNCFHPKAAIYVHVHILQPGDSHRKSLWLINSSY